jgi:hypothetical protein
MTREPTAKIKVILENGGSALDCGQRDEFGDHDVHHSLQSEINQVNRKR